MMPRPVLIAAGSTVAALVAVAVGAAALRLTPPMGELARELEISRRSDGKPTDPDDLAAVAFAGSRGQLRISPIPPAAPPAVWTLGARATSEEKAAATLDAALFEIRKALNDEALNDEALNDGDKEDEDDEDDEETLARWRGAPTWSGLRYPDRRVAIQAAILAFAAIETTLIALVLFKK